MSEGVGINVPIVTVCHFGDEPFQPITCTGTDNLSRTKQPRDRTHK